MIFLDLTFIINEQVEDSKIRGIFSDSRSVHYIWRLLFHNWITFIPNIRLQIRECPQPERGEQIAATIPQTTLENREHVGLLETKNIVINILDWNSDQVILRLWLQSKSSVEKGSKVTVSSEHQIFMNSKYNSLKFKLLFP